MGKQSEMMKYRYLLFLGMLLALPVMMTAQVKSNGPVPTVPQQKWQDMEFYLFVHFGPNTFTDLEWGHGTEKEEVFNPAGLDCRQWARIAKQAGAKGIIITAKHHDGFCLWPSKYSTHTVRESGWRNGKGDVLKELSEACKEYGLKFGVYISPWDRNHPKYGTPEYNDVYVNMMKEIFAAYGPIWELWWDGANGEGPNGKKQVYDWHRFEKTIRTISPNTIIFSDIGPDTRWVGNERGFAGTTNWNLLDTAGFSRGHGAPSQDTLNSGNVNGHNWIPAECDVSIRPGWFYHAKEDDKVKTPEELFDLYVKSVGRGANLLLNVPPDRRGLMNGHDSAALMGFRKLREESFARNLAASAKAYCMVNGKDRRARALNDGNPQTAVHIPAAGQMAKVVFSGPQSVNCIVLRENLEKGQSCKKFRVLLTDGRQQVIKEIDGTTIGRKRILIFPDITVQGITLVIDDQKAPAAIGEIEAYRIDDSLVKAAAVNGR